MKCQLLFWNLNKNVKALQMLNILSREKDADVIVTAELPISEDEAAAGLSLTCDREYRAHPGRLWPRLEGFSG